MKGYIVINKEICKECHLCISVCNRDCISPSTEYNLKGYHPVFYNDNGKCNGCGLCATICPDVAIEVYRER
ncbi:MAG: 4Fe-4S binding protein [Deltaproteobacteria bacterium]|nr:4Fe-4S binding protein [Deltaproteobacteria bacterium]